MKRVALGIPSVRFLGTQLGMGYHGFLGVTDPAILHNFRPRPHETLASRSMDSIYHGIHGGSALPSVAGG